MEAQVAVSSTEQRAWVVLGQPPNHDKAAGCSLHLSAGIMRPAPTTIRAGLARYVLHRHGMTPSERQEAYVAKADRAHRMAMDQLREDKVYGSASTRREAYIAVFTTYWFMNGAAQTSVREALAV